MIYIHNSDWGVCLVCQMVKPGLKSFPNSLGHESERVPVYLQSLWSPQQRWVGVRRREIGLWRQWVSKVTQDVFRHFKSYRESEERNEKGSTQSIPGPSKEDIKEERERAQEIQWNDLRENGIGRVGIRGLSWLAGDWQLQEREMENGWGNIERNE